MKKIFILSVILGLFFVLNSNAQVVETTKNVTGKTVNGVKKGYKVSRKGVGKAYGKTKGFSKVAYRKTKNASVKSYKGTKRFIVKRANRAKKM